MPDGAAAVRVAAELVMEGVIEMELFGDFDAAIVSDVIAAAGPDVAIGFVGYGVRDVALTGS